MMRFFCILLFLSLKVVSQKNDSIYVEKTIKNTLILKSKGNYKKAFHTISNLENKLKNNNNLFLKGRTVFTKGRVEIDLGEYDKAIESAQKAIDFYIKCKNINEEAAAINLVGVAHYFKGSLDSTLVYYNKSFNLKKLNNADAEQLAITAYNIAIVYEDLGKFDKAILLYKEAANYLLNTSKKSFLADTYLGISNTYKLKRDYDNSNIYGEKALNLAIETYGENSPGTTFFYTSYASNLKRKGKLKLAKEFLSKAKNIREKSYGKFHLWTAEAYLRLGELSMQNKDYFDAENKLKTAIDIAKNINNNLYGASAKLYLAQLFFDTQKSKKEAFTLVKESLEQFKTVYGENHQEVAECYLLLAKITKDKKYLEKVFKSAKYNPKNLNGIIAPFQVLKAFKYQSKLLKEAQKDLLQFNLIDSQLEVIKYIKKGFATEKSKILFANTLKEILEENILVCYKLFFKTKNRAYLKKAIELSEVNRNSILLSAVKKKKLGNLISKEDLKKEQKLIEDKNKIDFAIHIEESKTTFSKETLNNLYEERINIYEELNIFQEELLKSYPKYKKLVSLSQETNFEELKSVANQNQTIISYFLGSKNTFVFVFNSDEILFKRIENTSDLPKLISGLQKDIIKIKPINETSKKLYNLIVKPVQNSLKGELIFIPDGQLNYIPFEILQNENNKYLIHDKIISYSGSLNLFYEQQKKQQLKFKKPWVGFSPSYEKNKKLAENSSEIQNISDLMNGTFFTGKTATIKNFKQFYNNTSTLHLAMHAKTNQENPKYSKLLFTNNALKYSDIYTSKINANMVVLSACETGYGNIEKGEGVMSLSRAFSYAGVSSTVTSLWKVPDKETTLLMKEFYKKLKQGVPKNKALQLAKNNYLKNQKIEELKHPFFWAGFVVTGNTEPIQKNDYLYIVLGGCLFLILLFLFRKKLFNVSPIHNNQPL